MNNGGLFFLSSVILIRLAVRVRDNNDEGRSKPKYCGRVEVCLSDIESIENAINGGADSIEICVDRGNGGITPSTGLIEKAVELTRGKNVTVNVLIRPRAGNFVYNSFDFEIIKRDVLAAKEAGACGVVVGFLTPSNEIDVSQLKIIRKLSEGMILTFHRAFDVCRQPEESLMRIIDAGCDRLLTSGCSTSAADVEGLKLLKRMQEISHGRIKIIGAAGIKASNARLVVDQTGIYGVHAGSAVTARKTHEYLKAIQNNSSNQPNSKPITVHIGLNTSNDSTPESLDTWEVVDVALVSELVRSVTPAIH